MKLVPRVPLVLLAAAAIPSASGQSADPPVSLPEFFVPGQRVGALAIALPRGDLRPPEPNLGQELLALPGVYGQARAADAMEPSIRGLGFDRVATTVDGLPLVNATPERTNSPIVILGPVAVTGVTLVKALPSVTLGPVTTGGHLALQTEAPDAERTSRPCEGLLSSTYNGAREGFSTRGRLNVQAGGWNAGATFFRNTLHDYTAADGRVVAAGLDDLGASASLGWRTDQHRARFELLQRRVRRQEAVALPLDGKNSESDVLTFNDQWSNPAPGALRTIAWRAGYAYTDPSITSEDRIAPSLTVAQGVARSFGAGVTSVWHGSAGDALSLGADYARQMRRAIRTTAAGKDYIWPSATYADAGLFAEWRRRLAADWKLRLGVRADDVKSDAADADKPALGRPIRDQYATYNGADAAATSRHDTVAAANLLLEWKSAAPVTGFIGVGSSAQPAGVMERYRAFLNALGGDGRGGNAVELGNPALRSERKDAFELGGTWRDGWIEVEATAYYYRVDNFILRTPIGTTVSPLPRMVVFGYRNRDATFQGAELAATIKPAKAWSIPLTYAVSQGKHADSGVGLSEIPPWEATGAIRYHGSAAGRPVALEFGDRVVGEKDNPAPLENPLLGHAAGFSVWHARAGVSITPNLRIDVGLENALDRRYTEYLTPPVAPFRPASGNLLPGERVPAPGRSTWVSVTLVW